MATTVSIIDVDLDTSTIITDEIKELTSQNRRQIDDFRAVQATIAAVKAKKQESPEKQKIAELYNVLEAAGSAGILASTVLEQAGMTSGQFTTRMKTHLRQQDNKWALMKIKKQKLDYFVFLPYNQE